ncbi:MAG: FAD-dependent oxidoreductase [Acidobacteria bacterium]|nr:FAD-dependent oxidoreductase [Acidobacteriota bacterium]
MRVAVVGSGISGLTAAWLLSRRHEMHLFEKDTRLGGHTHTHSIQTSQGPRPIDSGFIVHNDRTYPNLIRLFAEIGVECENSDMSWGVTDHEGFEYSSRGASGFFANPLRLASPTHWQLLRDILRFNREALQLLRQGKAESMMLGVFIEERGYSAAFRDYYLYPTVAAIWSTSPRKVLEFPAATLIRFFDNHGLLGISGHPQWRVLRGGSSVYIPKLTAPLDGNIHAGKPVVSVTRVQGGVEVKQDGEEGLRFDAAVIAAHAPQALALLRDSSPLEREILESFRVTSNEAVLHTDTSILPRRKAAWASWNYRIPPERVAPATLTYDMNRLQNIDTPERYLVTLNSTERIDPSKILRRMNYQHPLYTLEAVRAQSRWSEISGANGVHFCGAYWFNGFHEDGYKSSLRVAQALGVPCEIL